MDLQSIKNRFGIIGTSPLLNQAIEVAVRVAPTDLSVLVTGESGSGKEFFPQVVHAFSSRRHAKYIAVNCGAIPEGTIDSELFGHEKGAFTGAVDSRKGYFEEADGGTIFLDEVGELPLATQARLLRVLQTGEYIRVGSSQIKKTDVRVVAATNNNLLKQIQEGKFREDLYYRLNTVPLQIPSLRERPEDIPILFNKFASDIALRYRMPAISLSDDAYQLLRSYYWRGNVRQLKNVAEQISAVEQNRDINAQVLSKYLPKEESFSSPVFAAQSSSENFSGSMNSEREILYKILFDMRYEISEIKRMLMEMRGGSYQPAETHAAPMGHALPQYIHAPKQESQAEYVPSEVVEPAEVRRETKDDALREKILQALRNNGGSRRAAAMELFMSERTLYRKIKELGIEI